MRDGKLVRNDSDQITTLDSEAWARALSAHVHEDLRWKILHFLPGMRLEVVRDQCNDKGTPQEDPNTRTVWLPGAGAMVDITPAWSVFGGVYRGFSPVAPGQPKEVQPELSWNQEAGTRLAMADLYVEVVGFINEYQNLTGQCTISGGCIGGDLDQQFSGGAARVRGLESSLQYVLLLPGSFTMPVQGAYTLTQGQFRTSFVSSFPQFGEVDAGDFLPYVPRSQGYGRVTVAHPRFDIGVGVSHRSEMLDAAGQWGDSEHNIPAMWLLDAGARGFITDRVTAYATGTNLNQSTAITSWRPIGARPTAPLQVMVGVEVRSPNPQQ
jgi:Fe(3+) dicitrate transport protein